MSATNVQRPEIVVTQDDHEVLIDLAHKALGRAPGAAMLLEEMERATLVPAEALPAGVLAMNGAVAFEYDGRTYRDFRLVHPAGANFAEGRISVLTPVGAALIGLAQGQSIWWPDPDGAIHRLTVTQVGAPAA
ncbi:MAG: nucleoside diphosphate kinase regulator [Terricaulis sp.]|nr:nucleoside diphosphate kinase regulator [Terricaulis sp.]